MTSEEWNFLPAGQARRETTLRLWQAVGRRYPPETGPVPKVDLDRAGLTHLVLLDRVHPQHRDEAWYADVERWLAYRPPTDVERDAPPVLREVGHLSKQVLLATVRATGDRRAAGMALCGVLYERRNAVWVDEARAFLAAAGWKEKDR